MHDYSKILVALDIYTVFEPIIKRACTLTSKPDAIHLVHVTLPRIYFEPYDAAFATNFEEDIRQLSNNKLHVIGAEHQISKEHVHNVIGHPANEIHNLAAQIKADLIVLGTHGRSGVKLLLGSTANAVLHGAKCDVLAVKI